MEAVFNLEPWWSESTSILDSYEEKVEGRNKNVLLNNRHMVKDHSVREEILCPHMGYSFQQGLFYMCHPTDTITHTTTFVTSVMEHWVEWEIAQWFHHEGSIRWPIAPWVNALTTELHLPESWKSNSFTGLRF